MRRWALLWFVALASAAVLAAEWMRAPGWLLALGALVPAAASAWAAARAGAPRLARALLATGSLAAAALGLLEAVTTARLARITSSWPDVQREMTTLAARRLVGSMRDAVTLARDLADGAAATDTHAETQAFDRLDGLTRHRGPAHGVMVFDPQGRAAAWAGTQRVVVGPDGPALSVVTTPFYLWLVARRQVNGTTGVGTVLIARSLGVPLAGAALTEEFVGTTGVGLRFLPPGTLPPDSAVINFAGPEGDTLFSVEIVTPEQGVARDEVLAPAQRAGIALAALVLGLAVVGAVRLRLGLAWLAFGAVGAALLLARAPLEEAFGASGVFGAATYYRGLLGPSSASAGALAISGAVSAYLAIGLWRRGLRTHWWHIVAAVALVVAAPYLLQNLAKGITPPAGDVPAMLWMTWQVALALAASAVVLLGAALVRGPAAPPHGGLWPWVAAALALALATAGLWLFRPGAAWPEWYPYLWLPALLLAIKPMPLRATLATVAVVSGTAAALLTWRATTESRLALAAADAEGLGGAPDPVVLALADRTAAQVAAAPLPATAGDLFVLYRRSALDGQGFPVALALWTGEGERLVTLDLATLDLPLAIVQGLAREAATGRRTLAASYAWVPGVIRVVAVPLADGRVLTLEVGPHTRLVPQTREGRFLEGGGEAEPPYRIALSPPESAPRAPTAGVSWRRDGWLLRGERGLAMPGGLRHLHLQVDLRGAWPVLQRGLLVLLVDVAILSLLWLLIEATGGRVLPVLRVAWPRTYRSLRARLTASLALALVLPTLAFATWGYARLGDEFRRARELLLRQQLRDASGVLSSDVRNPSAALVTLALRVDADLALSQGGRVVAASAPVLADLGLLDVLVPPAAFRRLAFGDELELTQRQEASPGDVLAAYRLVRPGPPPDAVILAAVELLGDSSLRQREQDLGITTLVAALLAVVAAMLLSGLAARALDRPIQQLRRAALAVGAGEGVGAHLDYLPAELEPVYASLEQAAADVERGQRAERVLAWGEMARQVAHEIKNPLTPIRLGIQHLLRVHRERPLDLGPTLDTTGQRLLGEIDRLDAIARTFSRFALPAAAGPALEAVDAVAAAAEVVNLYRLGESPVTWTLDVVAVPPVAARRGELVEVLVNLFENARDAGARRVDVRVRPGAGDGPPWAAVVSITDDGRGIPADLLPRVFEPRFSATSSGSGLGLAIVKRLVDDWGAEVALESVVGRGTTAIIRLRAPSTVAPQSSV